MILQLESKVETILRYLFRSSEKAELKKGTEHDLFFPALYSETRKTTDEFFL